MIQKTSAPGTAELGLRFDAPKAETGITELGLRGPRKDGAVFFKIWCNKCVWKVAMPHF